MNRRSVLRLLTATGFACSFGSIDAADALNEQMTGDFSPVHDPCIVKADGIYHVFSTSQSSDGIGLIAWRTSRDLMHWELRGSVFDAIPGWAQQAIPGTRGLWAPDIAYIGGEYRLYYSCSTFGSNRSAIGLAVTSTLDPDSRAGWQDRGMVIESRRDEDFNAIDPNLIVDRDGRHWLALGSFWSGLKLFPVDAATGKCPPSARKYSLASRPVPEKAPGAIEAPFLIERDGWYYLFASFDYCCRGASSSYYLVVGRSKKITGPYVGRDGKRMLDGYGTLLLQGNRRYRGPGHCAVLRDTDGDHLVYHAYDAEAEGRPVLRISPIAWTPDGWPTVTL